MPGERRYTLGEAEIRHRYGVPLSYLAPRTGPKGYYRERLLRWNIESLRKRQARADKDRGGGADRIAELEGEIEKLRRGEFICSRCYLRKDGEGPKGDF